eukprot:4466414-Amphidinium_carterae.2
MAAQPRTVKKKSKAKDLSVDFHALSELRPPPQFPAPQPRYPSSLELTAHPEKLFEWLRSGILEAMLFAQTREWLARCAGNEKETGHWCT